MCRGAAQLESGLGGKALGVLVGAKLNTSRRCALVSCITSRSREVVLPLHVALVRPRLERRVQLWAASTRDRDVVEQVQKDCEDG